ncbi:MAG: DUF4139 domain-containing protein [Gemmataceae bacterium]|nr:DUF4139 domain-containing protein [Gemmataceae bacterium]MCI0742385.1 DUF4139 domain-containing protein [Gemmataceae bacterium]
MFRGCMLLLLTAIFTQPVLGQETSAKSKIVSVGLFKNGLAVVKRLVEITEPGTFRLESIPDAVHGTFWIESNAKVESALRFRELEPAADQPPEGSLQEIFAGKKVTVHLSNNKVAPVTGTAVKFAPAPPRNGTPASVSYYERHPTAERFLVLKTAKGHVYVTHSEIAAVETEDNGKAVKRTAVLTLTVEKAAEKPLVYVSYLAHGLAWAPSYRVDISDPKTLAVEMATVLRNELADFENADVSLISGFPSVEFANVSSPLQAHTDWTRFFQQLSQRGGAEHVLLTQNFTSNSIKIASGPRIDLSAIPAGEGVDLHFEPIGKRSLLRGEALSLTVGKTKAPYERVVEWTVGSGDGGRRDQSRDEMWDVLHFKNPFQFPLTTAPALVVENGKFNGQRTCFWTNVGEETNLRITKSLSLRTQCLEEEDKAKPTERVAVGRRDYTRIHLKGELLVNNHRKQPVKMHILYSIRGNVGPLEGAPRITPREGSLTDINPIRDVAWVVTLAPGEEKRLSYGYNTLVDR